MANSFGIKVSPVRAFLALLVFPGLAIRVAGDIGGRGDIKDAGAVVEGKTYVAVRTLSSLNIPFSAVVTDLLADFIA